MPPRPSDIPSSFGPLQSAVNGTGVILHTGLGRAPLSGAARRAVLEIIEGYCTLEIDRFSGKRGSRHDLVSDTLCELTGAESAIVVNNNAAAVMLILHALALNCEVVISRGQLVEIGGSFRMPDVMVAGGVRLVSVGSTNHTEVNDYRSAVTERTAIFMAVDRSNFDFAGHDQSVSLKALVSLGREKGIPVVYDQGSGTMIDLSPYGLDGGNTVRDALENGVDVVCFSGDKLLGGPQAGIIVGNRELINRMKTDPLMRAFRADKMVYAALRATLELISNSKELESDHGVISMLAATSRQLESRARRLAGRLRTHLYNRADNTVDASQSEIGGGALPVQQLPSHAVSLRPFVGTNRQLAAAFRRFDPPVFGRLSGDRFLIDVRTLSKRDLRVVERAASEVGKYMDEKENVNK